MSLFLSIIITVDVTVLPNWHISSKASHEVLGHLRRLDEVFQGQYLPIDLFTDTAAILNLLDLRSIMVCPGALAGKTRTSLYMSREKGEHYYIQTRHDDLFFPIQSFYRKT